MMFEPGMQFSRDGIMFRTLPGTRCGNDMVIEISLDGGVHWKRPHISLILILTDFKCQVEENNYGSNNGQVSRGQGAWYLLKRIISAWKDGWEIAADKTAFEAAQARLRRAEQPQLSLSL